MTVIIEIFRPEVSPDVPGCPFFLIDKAIRNSAIEFCDYTLTWRSEMDRTRIVVGTMDYDITPPICSTLVTVRYVSHGGIKVIPTTELMLDDTIDGWRDKNNRSDVATFFYLPDRKTIRICLSPSLQANKNLSFECVYRPSQTATTLPMRLFNYNMEAIVHGAKARLFVANASWSNPSLAVYHRNEFEKLMKKEKAERINDYTRTSTFRCIPIGY